MITLSDIPASMVQSQSQPAFCLKTEENASALMPGLCPRPQLGLGSCLQTSLPTHASSWGGPDRTNKCAAYDVNSRVCAGWTEQARSYPVLLVSTDHRVHQDSRLTAQQRGS